MNSKSKRPPIPSTVTVGWFWDPGQQEWIIDWTSTDPKLCRLACQDGFPHRHRYVTYRAKRGKQ